MRYCIPWVSGRGAGLGNEIIPWTKALIAGAELGLHTLRPAFGLSQYGYRRYFRTSRLDWVYQGVLSRALPTFRFTEAEYRATGCEDFGEAIRVFGDAHGIAHRSACVLQVEGMWGGYCAIARGKDLIRAQLYGARGVSGNLFALRKRLDPQRLIAAVHMRLGDFAVVTDQESIRGRFNVALPYEWYERVCGALVEQTSGATQFVLFSNGRPEQLRTFIQRFHPIVTMDLPDSDVSDLLAMSQADVLVSSVSSYSLCAAWLSDNVYLWYAPQLQDHQDAWSLWGHEPAQQAAHGITSRNLMALRSEDPKHVGGPMPRGLPIEADGILPPMLKDHLLTLLGRRNPGTDLLQYGVVPKTAVARFP